MPENWSWNIQTFHELSDHAGVHRQSEGDDEISRVQRSFLICVTTAAEGENK